MGLGVRLQSPEATGSSPTAQTRCSPPHRLRALVHPVSTRVLTRDLVGVTRRLNAFTRFIFLNSGNLFP